MRPPDQAVLRYVRPLWFCPIGNPEVRLLLDIASPLGYRYPTIYGELSV